MKYIPTKRSVFIAQMKADWHCYTDGELNDIYNQMCKDAAIGLMAMTALGGYFSNQEPDFSVFFGIKGLKEELAQETMAKELGVDISEIDAKKALEHYLKIFYNE